MMSSNYKENSECRHVRELLSDYLDNTLAARRVLEVERHLADCPDCAALVREMEATVHLLRTAETYDTSDDFMVKLHARLDGLAPEPTQSRSVLTAARDWLAGVRENLQVRRVPALSLGVAAVALVAIFLVPRTPVPVPPEKAPQQVNRQVVASATQHNVALAASNPFDDPFAAKAAEDGQNSDVTLF